MYGLYLLAKKKKKNPIFHLRFLSRMSLKAFLRCEKPGFSYPKTLPPLIPTPQLAGRWGILPPPLRDISLPTESFLVRHTWFLSLWLCSVRVSWPKEQANLSSHSLGLHLPLGKPRRFVHVDIQIQCHSHSLGLHTCLVQPMRFIYWKIQMGNDQGIQFWLWWFGLQRVS